MIGTELASTMPAPVSKAPLSDSKLAGLPDAMRRWFATGLISVERWQSLPVEQQQAILVHDREEGLIQRLAEARLITPYQTERLMRGQHLELLLGQYRLLEVIGSGGMGIVYRAEHIRTDQPVAVKVLSFSSDKRRKSIDRFFNEVEAVTKLKHPHIVAALDVGEDPQNGPDGSSVPYLVMEYISGRNLEQLVQEDGPLGIVQACWIAHQIADALSEAHRQGVIHRDVKPGNVIICPDGSAKLLDFGVARLPYLDDRLTREGGRLGTIAYMAPEQVRNPRDVDARADVFGVGSTLYYMLTGRDPFEPPAGSASALRVPPLRGARPDVSLQLEAVINRLMALTPTERVPSAESAMRELMPFITDLTNTTTVTPHPEQRLGPSAATIYRILIVDDQADIRKVCRKALSRDVIECDEVGTGPDAIERIQREKYDLILLDVDLPGCSGEEVLREIRKKPPSPFLKVIMLSGRTDGDDLARLLAGGADDFLTKPFSLVQLRARAKAALRLKEAQDRSELLNARLQTVNGELERSISMKDGELLHARGAMVLALAKIVEQRSAETGAHLIRLQRYSRVLAEAAAATPAYAQRMDTHFIQALVDAAPLHDIGKSAVPDHILNKPGRLDPEERMRMEAHAVIGAETLQEVAYRYRFATGFLQMAIDLARHHHERWDGTGYPDRLSGEDIPLAARLLAICDVYDALRAKRSYKPSFSHNMAVMTMCESSPGHFDPTLLEIFKGCSTEFDAIYREMAEAETQVNDC